MREKFYLFLCLFFIVPFVCGTTVAVAEDLFDHSHNLFTEVLDEYVIARGKKTGVMYEELKGNPKKLQRYLTSVSSVTPAAFSKFSKDDQKAFLINAYNAFTLELLIKHYPIGSMEAIGNLVRSPWQIRWFKLLGKTRHLEFIQEEMLEKRYDDIRFHFALSRGSRGTPALRAEAYTGYSLDEQLEDQVRQFLRDKSKNFVVWEEKAIYLSRFLEKLERKLAEKNITMKQFVIPYIARTKDERERLSSKEFIVEYRDVDNRINVATDLFRGAY